MFPLLGQLNLQGGSPPPMGGVAVHPDYRISFLEATSYLVGEQVPLKWSIMRLDGLPVAIPTSATIVITPDIGAPTLLSAVDTDSSTPSPTLICSALYLFSVSGRFRVRLNVTMPGDGQVRSESEQIIIL